MSLVPPLDILGIRKRLGRKEFDIPKPHGGEGSNSWILDSLVDDTRIIVSCSDMPFVGTDRFDWVHASISHQDHTPTYDELAAMGRAVWPTGYGYQVFAPPERHVNIHPHALHLWGTVDGARLLPDFGILGTI